MKPDICHIGDGMRVRDGGNPKLRRRFDHAIEIGQFRRASKTIKKMLALFPAGIQETRKVACADKGMVAIKHDRELAGLCRHQRVELRII